MIWQIVRRLARARVPILSRLAALVVEDDDLADLVRWAATLTDDELSEAFVRSGPETGDLYYKALHQEMHKRAEKRG